MPGMKNCLRAALGHSWRAALAVALAWAAAGPGCSRKPPAAPSVPPPVPVRAAPAVARDVPITVNTFGIVEPYQTIAIKARVGGQLSKVLFVEGQKVMQGQQLFEIDPRPFQATVDQLTATLDRDTLQMDLNQRQAERTHELYSKGGASTDEEDTSHTTAQTSKATVASDKATLENAKLQLSYCFIAAPVTGIMGRWLIDQGNIVTANVDTLAVLNQIEPIRVTFNVPEKYLPEIRRRRAQGPLEVRVRVAPGAEEAGELTFIDNTVTEQTGTIALQGTFANHDLVLWPGQYFPVWLVLGVRTGAVLIPSRSVVSSQEGSYVFVIRPGGTVEHRVVITGLEIDGQTIISQGLSAGEMVVTDGQAKLMSGTTVVVLPTPPATAMAPTSAPTATGPTPFSPPPSPGATMPFPFGGGPGSQPTTGPACIGESICAAARHL